MGSQEAAATFKFEFVPGFFKQSETDTNPDEFGGEVEATSDQELVRPRWMKAENEHLSLIYGGIKRSYSQVRKCPRWLQNKD